MNTEYLEAKYNRQVFQMPEVDKEDLTISFEKLRAEEYNTSYKFAKKWIEQYEAKKQSEIEASKNNTILKTGFNMLDDNIKIFGKRLVMIIGRSGFGKTSFIAQMIRHQIMNNNRILMFSCEEAGEDFINRININSEIYEKMITNFVMCDKGNITLDDIKLSTIKMDLMGINPDIVYVDQLNKIKPDVEFKGSKHERIVYVSEQLQNLVKIINRPIVIVHQANRATEQKEEFATQGNVSDADAVYNEAQVCMFIESLEYREWCKTKQPYKSIFETWINTSKNRSVGGWTGAQLCYFDRSKGLFLTEDEYNQKESVKEYKDYRDNF